jgi:hypothetical protein
MTAAPHGGAPFQREPASQAAKIEGVFGFDTELPGP